MAATAATEAARSRVELIELRLLMQLCMYISVSLSSETKNSMGCLARRSERGLCLLFDAAIEGNFKDPMPAVLPNISMSCTDGRASSFEGVETSVDTGLQGSVFLLVAGSNASPWQGVVRRLVLDEKVSLTSLLIPGLRPSHDPNNQEHPEPTRVDLSSLLRTGSRVATSGRGLKFVSLSILVKFSEAATAIGDARFIWRKRLTPTH